MTLDEFLSLSQRANCSAVFDVVHKLIHGAKFCCQPWEHEVDVFDLHHGEEPWKREKKMKIRLCLHGPDTPSVYTEPFWNGFETDPNGPKIGLADFQVKFWIHPFGSVPDWFQTVPYKHLDRLQTVPV